MNFKIKGEEVIWEIKMPIVSTVLKFEEEHWRGFDYESGGQTLWFDQLVLKDADAIAHYDFYRQSMFILVWCNGEVQIILKTQDLKIFRER